MNVSSRTRTLQVGKSMFSFVSCSCFFTTCALLCGCLAIGLFLRPLLLAASARTHTTPTHTHTHARMRARVTTQSFGFDWPECCFFLVRVYAPCFLFAEGWWVKFEGRLANTGNRIYFIVGVVCLDAGWEYHDIVSVLSLSLSSRERTHAAVSCALFHVIIMG